MGLDREHLRTSSLLARVAQGDVEEVNPGPNPNCRGRGDGRSTWRICCVAQRCESPGLPPACPLGSDIEYADEVTMTRAMEGRRELKF